MASNKIFNFGPVALTTTLTTNILYVGTGAQATAPTGFTASDQYIVLRHIRIVNKTGSAATFSLWKGATGANAAGTEVVGQATSVAANSYFDWYGIMRFDSTAGTGFLVGGSGTATALSIQGEGEIGVSG